MFTGFFVSQPFQQLKLNKTCNAMFMCVCVWVVYFYVRLIKGQSHQNVILQIRSPSVTLHSQQVNQPLCKPLCLICHWKEFPFYKHNVCPERHQVTALTVMDILVKIHIILRTVLACIMIHGPTKCVQFWIILHIR